VLRREGMGRGLDREGPHEDLKLNKGLDWGFGLGLDCNILGLEVYLSFSLCSLKACHGFGFDCGFLGLEMCSCLSLYSLEACHGSEFDFHHSHADLSLRIGHGMVVFPLVASLHPHIEAFL
jgi:hypothetical protein